MMHSDRDHAIGHAAGTTAGDAAPGAASACAADQLEAAGQRVLLYLKALGVPLSARLTMADDVLRRAAELPGDSLAAAAMRCCMDMLNGTAGSRTPREAVFRNRLETLQSMPPLNRSSMIPLEFERTGPCMFFLLLAAGLVSAPLRAPHRRYVLLLVAVALAAYGAWQYLGQ
jgi:hypothetical protein